MSDKAKFSHSDFPNDKKLSIEINAKKNSNLQERLEVLYLLAKKHLGYMLRPSRIERFQENGPIDMYHPKLRERQQQKMSLQR